MTIDEQLIDYLTERTGTPITPDTQLIEGGLIDSMGIQEVIAFIESSFGVEFETDDLTVENFGTVKDMENLILSKKAKA